MIGDWLRWFWYGPPEPQYVARVSSPEFLADATLEDLNDGDFSHVLELEFDKPVGDGNRVAELCLKYNQFKRVARRVELWPGDESIQFNCEPVSGTFQAIFADRDGQIVANDEISITEVEP